MEASVECSEYWRLYLAKLANIWTEAEAWLETGEPAVGGERKCSITVQLCRCCTGSVKLLGINAVDPPLPI